MEEKIRGPQAGPSTSETWPKFLRVATCDRFGLGTVLSRTFLLRSLGVVLLLSVAPPIRGQSDPGYAGAQACAKCHAGVNHEWAGSLHARMMQPATNQSVKGDFAQSKIVLRGATYLLQYRDKNYYITESDLTGKPWEHRVEYTLGERRFQHYLTTLPDGRIIVMPPTWDITRKKWEFDLAIGNPEEGSEDPIQVWNKTCYSCHVSQGQKNFDLEKSWLSHDVAGFGDRLRKLPRPGKRAHRSGDERESYGHCHARPDKRGHRQPCAAGPGQQHDDLRAMPLVSRHLCEELQSRRELLRFLHAGDGIPLARLGGLCLLARRATPAISK